MNRARDGSGRDPAPWAFLGLTLAFTWTWWWAAVATGRSWDEPPVPVLFALGGVAPVLIAGLLVAGDRSSEPARTYWRRVVDPRPLLGRWLAVIAFLALAPTLVGRLVHGGGGVAAGGTTGSILLVAVLAGLAEEPGWRGYAQDALQRRRSVLASAWIVAVAWALWHLPLFFIEGSYQADLGVGSVAFWVFLVDKVPLSIVYAWVYLATGRSTMAVVLLHAGANAAGELLGVEGGELVELLAVTALAGLLLLVDGPRMMAGTSSPGAGSRRHAKARPVSGVEGPTSARDDLP